MSNSQPNKAIQVAQEIVDTVIDIRPEYANKRVINLSVSPPTEALKVYVYFDNGTTTAFVGLWAHEIAKHLHES